MEYQLTIGNQTRRLPLVPVNATTAIASFVLLGDDALTYQAAQLLAARLTTPFDYLVTVESKGLTLTHDLSRLTNHPRSFVIRKSIKSYMQQPLTTTVKSITTAQAQTLVLDGADAAALQGKKVILVDDVISTGESLKAAESLLQQAGSTVVGKAAVLAEGAAQKRTDVTFLAPLPLFNLDGTPQPA